MNTSETDNETGGFDLGKPKIFNAVWQEYQPSLFYQAFAILQNQQEAEDIVTESFIKLWRNRTDFSSKKAARAWLRITTRNACLNLLKHKKVDESHISKMATLLDDTEDKLTNEDLWAKLLQTIYQEIEALPLKSREVFKLRYLQGMKNEEIAALLNINNQSVRDHLVRALKALRLSIGKNNELLGLLLVLYYVMN